MPFPESVKLEVKKRSLFKCCICHEPDVEIHHIIPDSEGGPNSVDNAAPLCARCHDIWGGNPQKRKFIRESRDRWYEVCEKRYPDAEKRFAEIESKVGELTSSVKSIALITGASVATTGFMSRLDNTRKPGEIRSFADTIEYVAFGYSPKEKNPFLGELAMLFGATSFSGELANDSETTVVLFRDSAEALDAFSAVVKAYQAVQESGNDPNQHFLPALAQQFLPQFTTYALARASGKQAHNQTVVAENYMVFGIKKDYAPYVDAACRFLREIKGDFTIAPDSEGILFRNLAGLRAWAVTIEDANKCGDDRDKVLQVVAERVLEFSITSGFAQD